MLTMTAGGCLWNEAREGNGPVYKSLVEGWSKWNAKNTDGTITDTNYPHVAFFDQLINPPALRRILLTMLNPDPSKRVSMASVANNRWLKKIECCQIDSYDDPAVKIDASMMKLCSKNMSKVVHHNHLPPTRHFGHGLVRLPGSTDM